MNCITNRVDREQNETTGPAGAWDRHVSSPLVCFSFFYISSLSSNTCLTDWPCLQPPSAPRTTATGARDKTFLEPRAQPHVSYNISISIYTLLMYAYSPWPPLPIPPPSHSVTPATTTATLSIRKMVVTRKTEVAWKASKLSRTMPSRSCRNAFFFATVFFLVTFLFLRSTCDILNSSQILVRVSYSLLFLSLNHYLIFTWFWLLHSLLTIKSGKGTLSRIKLVSGLENESFPWYK